MILDNIREVVRTNLLRLLAEEGCTQKELADRLQISKSAITNWTKGKNSPSIEYLAQICDEFDRDIAEFFKIDKKIPDTEKSVSGAKDYDKIGALYDAMVKVGYIPAGGDLSEVKKKKLAVLVDLAQTIFLEDAD